MESKLPQGPASRIDWSIYMPGISIDGVIFGYRAGRLRILLHEYKEIDFFGLPGGFLKYDESLDQAAARIVRERSGLHDVYLNQFYTFGSLQRSNPQVMKELMYRQGAQLPKDHWLFGRFLSVGYYALVDYEKARPVPDAFSDSCSWHDVYALPDLMLDHEKIAFKAFEQLRERVEHKPIGSNLLDERFTMSELQLLHETILGKKLHRTGFHRKMMQSGRLLRHGKKNIGKAHRAPFLYSFNPALNQ